MRVVRPMLLGTVAIIVSALAPQNFLSVTAQEPAQGIYWKPEDVVTAQNLPRVSSDQEALPNPYYEVQNFLRLPEGTLGLGLQHVAFDSRGNIWTLDAGSPPLHVFDSSGRFLRSVGDGVPFASPHFLYIDRDDNLWVADNAARPGRGNQLTKLSPDGKVLLTLGKPGVKGGSPENFMGLSGVVTNAAGDIFVVDGHFVEPDGGGRSMAGEFAYWQQGTREVTHMRVAKFSKDGKFIKQWGKEGSGPGEFYVPHGIAMDSRGRLFVADRGNNRIQIFDQDGKFLDQWKQFGKPCDVFIDANDTLYVVDSDSNKDLWTWKYSTIGNGILSNLTRVPRLTDIGSPSPEFTQGIRIGSARDGVVRAFIPPHVGPTGPTTVAERVRADATGRLFVSEIRSKDMKVYVKHVELPEGKGKPLVQKACQSCHDFRQFPRVNFDRDDWDTVVKTMVAGGAPLSQDEIPVAIDYLAASFKGSAPGVVAPGKVQATITAWDLPTPHSLPHDIISTRTGVYYTGQFANVLGRFDPKTWQFEEHRLRPGTNPVSLLEEAGGPVLGTIYFTSNTDSTIGRFHPFPGYLGHWQKGDVFTHPIPGPEPQRPRFRLHDLAMGLITLWFTIPEAKPPSYPEGGKIGLFHELTFEVKLADLPTGSGDPSGLAVNSKWVPFFTYRNSPRLGTVDPRTMQVTEYLMPDPGSGATSITITPDDAVWYTDSLRGYIGRFVPETSKFSEWPSPSGSRSLPDAMTRVGNIIWYAESGTKPNMLVRFDPKTETFQSWEVKAGGGIKHIYADRDGSLWLARPLTNGIAHVTMKED